MMPLALLTAAGRGRGLQDTLPLSLPQTRPRGDSHGASERPTPAQTAGMQKARARAGACEAQREEAGDLCPASKPGFGRSGSFRGGLGGEA